MAAMATDSHSDDLDPDAVGRREFTRSRRGFDQIEVRAFLNAIAAQLRTERQRQVELTRKLADAEARATRSRASDAQRMTTVLGEETARIIEAARAAAEEMRERVEAETTQLREEASQRLDDAKQEAEATLAQARADAVAARDQATTEAMAEVEQAKDRAREMVEEAHAHRERVMADVAKRRKGLRAQYQTLAGVRDQMLERLDASQGLLGGAIDEVRRALNEEVQLVHPVEPPDELDADHDDATGAAAHDEEERVFHRVRTPAPPSVEAEAVEESVELVDAESEDEDVEVTDAADDISVADEAAEAVPEPEEMELGEIDELATRPSPTRPSPTRPSPTRPSPTRPSPTRRRIPTVRTSTSCSPSSGPSRSGTTSPDRPMTTWTSPHPGTTPTPCSIFGTRRVGARPTTTSPLRPIPASTRSGPGTRR